MSIKLALVVAALVTVVAGPALAHQTERHTPSDAFASARMGTPAPMPVSQGDFQLQGRF
jgi:hypothetical protein